MIEQSKKPKNAENPVKASATAAKEIKFPTQKTLIAPSKAMTKITCYQPYIPSYAFCRVLLILFLAQRVNLSEAPTLQAQSSREIQSAVFEAGYHKRHPELLVGDIRPLRMEPQNR